MKLVRHGARLLRCHRDIGHGSLGSQLLHGDGYAVVHHLLLLGSHLSLQLTLELTLKLPLKLALKLTLKLTL